MILHPGILALFVGSLASSTLILYASAIGIRILRYWDISSSSELQLSLERRTYLVSTIMSFALAFEVLSVFLFIYTVDDIHVQFVGAMCATGSLNANPVGWYLLYLRILVFFLAFLWIGLNYIDQRTETLPLVKIRYAFLILIAPLVLLELYLGYRYFTGLRPDIITSCCGSLFSGESKNIAGALSSLPVTPMEYVFFITGGVYLVTGAISLRSYLARYAMGVLAVVFLVVSLASVVSFISLYFYELPTHHCPFDILQGYYHYIGYPLYGTLFCGTALGMLVGVVECLKKRFRLDEKVDRYQRKWVLFSMGLIVMFIAISVYPMVFSSFTLEGY